MVYYWATTMGKY
jgi:5-methylcytosine-specific restriction endonuclease McrA